jgi:hypothetical protein
VCKSAFANNCDERAPEAECCGVQGPGGWRYGESLCVLACAAWVHSITHAARGCLCRLQKIVIYFLFVLACVCIWLCSAALCPSMLLAVRCLCCSLQHVNWLTLQTLHAAAACAPQHL